MGHGALPRPVMRTWTLEVRPSPAGMALICPHCGRVPVAPGLAATQVVVVNHLALHARSEPLSAHLRTCRCGEHGCRWHPRHRGCNGPIVLLLTRGAGGRIWRLTDACRACTAATDHAAMVPEPCDSGDAAAEKGAGPGEPPHAPGSEDLAETELYWHDGALYG